MHEYNWKRLLNKCINAVTGYFSLFQYLKKFTLFLKKRRTRLFKLYQALFNCKKFTFSFFPASHFGKVFCSTVIFTFFQIISVFYFFASQNQYFIMFKDSNVFEFTNFPFKTKYVVLSYCRLFQYDKFCHTIVYSVNNNYLFSRETQEKK